MYTYKTYLREKWVASGVTSYSSRKTTYEIFSDPMDMKDLNDIHSWKDIGSFRYVIDINKNKTYFFDVGLIHQEALDALRKAGVVDFSWKDIFVDGYPAYCGTLSYGRHESDSFEGDTDFRGTGETKKEIIHNLIEALDVDSGTLLRRRLNGYSWFDLRGLQSYLERIKDL